MTEPAELLQRLSRREREVLRLVGQCASYQRVGRELAISPHTVKVYVGRVCTKLGLGDGGRPREQLISFYQRHRDLADQLAPA